MDHIQIPDAREESLTEDTMKNVQICRQLISKPIWPYCTVKVHPVTKKETYELATYLDILHRVFRETLFPRIGNLDMALSSVCFLLMLAEKEACP